MDELLSWLKQPQNANASIISIENKVKYILKKKRAHSAAIGLLFNVRSFWIGVHYSKHNKRFCVNLIPGCTVWIVLKNGFKP